VELPEDSIGITDLLAYHECGRRFSYGMKRHTGIGMQSDDETPESGSYATWYGSAIHLIIEEVEDGSSDDAALQTAFARYGHALDPSDLDLLRDDLVVYRSRDPGNVRTLANEDEFRVPLFKYQGRQIYFRFKLDRLYERLDAPGHFLHVDYKSSRHAKAEKEVHGDKQLWAYNFGVHEFWPEAERLVQLYDQLRYGQVPTSKNAAQREQMREWLIRGATAIIEDEDWQPDELLEPRKNQWCAWCPIMESCPVIAALTEFALLEIETLAPAEKVGRKTVLNLDESLMGQYVERLEEAKQAIRILERFRDSVNSIIKRMPEDERLDLGYRLRGKKARVWTADQKRQIASRLGPDFFELVTVTKSGLESILADDAETLAWALDLALETAGAESGETGWLGSDALVVAAKPFSACPNTFRCIQNRSKVGKSVGATSLHDQRTRRARGPRRRGPRQGRGDHPRRRPLLRPDQPRVRRAGRRRRAERRSGGYRGAFSFFGGFRRG
jgi:ketosteroid isomerase-like protein